jgi:hypothetical protein
MVEQYNVYIKSSRERNELIHAHYVDWIIIEGWRHYTLRPRKKKGEGTEKETERGKVYNIVRKKIGVTIAAESQLMVVS